MPSITINGKVCEFEAGQVISLRLVPSVAVARRRPEITEYLDVTIERSLTVTLPPEQDAVASDPPADKKHDE